MLKEIVRLADRFSDIVLEGSNEASSLIEDGALHPMGIVAAVVVLAISIVAVATGLAFAVDHIMDGAMTLTLGHGA